MIAFGKHLCLFNSRLDNWYVFMRITIGPLHSLLNCNCMLSCLQVSDDSRQEYRCFKDLLGHTRCVLIMYRWIPPDTARWKGIYLSDKLPASYRTIIAGVESLPFFPGPSNSAGSV